MNSKKEAGPEIEDFRKGFRTAHEFYCCLFCREKIRRDEVFKIGGGWFTAEAKMMEHLKKVHGTVLDSLLQYGSKQTGVSDIQAAVLRGSFHGKTDKELAKELEIAESTVRNHRFRLKERVSQAKIFLAIMELMESRQPEDAKIIDLPSKTKVIDERFSITEAERKELLDKYLLPEGRFSRFPKKEKHKIVLLLHVLGTLDKERRYSEVELNEVIMNFIDDYVTFRRYLIQYRLMERTPNGSAYWVAG